MKILKSILIMAVAILGLQCDDDPVDPPPPPPAPENQPPGSFTTAVEISQNMAELSWTASEDPDEDNITYSILLEDSLVSEQTETSLALTDLVFERDYQGKIIADDGNGHQQETTFNFTTGFLWLAVYESNNGSGNGYTYQYDDHELLITTKRTPTGDPNNITYDASGQVFAVGDYTYTHNDNGLLTKISDGTGRGDLELLYDDQDRLNKVRITRTSPSNNYIGTVNMTCDYDGIGNLAIVNYHRRYTSDNTNGQVNNYHRRKYIYDNAGNITEFRFETSDDDGVTYEESIKEQFTYDLDHKDPWYSLLTRQLGLSSRIYFGLRGEFDPQGAVSYNIEGYGLKLLRSEHTVTNHKIFSNGDLILEYDYDYTYNESGYPTSANVTVGNNEFFPRWSYNGDE